MFISREGSFPGLARTRQSLYSLALIAVIGMPTLLNLAGCFGDGPPGAISGTDTVTATPSVSAAAVVIGGRQTVSVSFNSSGTMAVTNVTVTSGLLAMPSGWSGPSSFSCTNVSTGSGCVLNLEYAPTALGSGTLAIGYRYTNSTGGAKTGTVNIPYAATTNDNVVGTALPAGQITATVGNGAQAVMVTFTTDDGNTATHLALTSNLANLPAGWSSTVSSFACASASTGSGCQLPLSFRPTAGGSGTVTLAYSYIDNAGTAKTGTVNIPYTATTNDNVVATTSPTGQINGVVGSAGQPVTVTFTTDDGFAASGLNLTTALSSLPSGWSSAASSFSCGTVSTGTTCQLSLTYGPTMVGSGTLTLNYSYTDDAGAAKTGSANIPYASTSNNNVVAADSPSGQINATVGGSTTVTVTFTTDDSNPATSFSVTGGLSSLPTGWSSGSSSFSCSTVSTGTGCQLMLTYAPTVTGSGTVTLNYGYDDNAGAAKTGTLNIPYAATALHLYVTNLVSTVDECTLGTGGAPSSCAATASGGSASPTGIAFYGNVAYITDFDNGAVDVCTANSDGSISGCSAVTGFFYPWAVAVSGNYLYVTTANIHGTTMACQIGSGGSLSFSNCSNTGITYATGIAVGGGHAYYSAYSSVYVCVANADGSISGCNSTGSGWHNPQFITLSGGYAYVGNQNGNVNVCTVGALGALTSCAQSSTGGYSPNAVAIYGNDAYVSDDNYNIYECTISSGGATLTNCAVANGGASYGLPQQLAIH